MCARVSVCPCLTSFYLLFRLLASYQRALSAMTAKQQKETTKLKLFFRSWLLFLSSLSHVTSNDGASSASYNSQLSNLLCKSTWWLSLYRAPFISSTLGFSSIHAAVIFFSRSFGNLSSMGWLTKGLLLHPPHLNHPSFYYLRNFLLNGLLLIFDWLKTLMSESQIYGCHSFNIRHLLSFSFVVENIQLKDKCISFEL